MLIHHDSGSPSPTNQKALTVSGGRPLGPPPLPFGGLAAGRWRSSDLFFHRFILVFFRIWFSSDIDEVVAMMTLWNKVSPAFPYLDDVRSGADDGQVRASAAKSEGSSRSLQLVCQSRDVVGCLLLWRLRHLLSIYSATRFDFFNPLFWW